jgi:hypothetical protein
VGTPSVATLIERCRESYLMSSRDWFMELQPRMALWGGSFVPPDRKAWSRCAAGRLTHPDFYYGFVGLGLLRQLVLVVIATDPQRNRPVMAITVLGKFVYTVPVFILFARGEAPWVDCAGKAYTDCSALIERATGVGKSWSCTLSADGPGVSGHPWPRPTELPRKYRAAIAMSAAQ